MRIAARLLGCAYLVYLVVDGFFGVSHEELGMSPAAKYAVIAVFLAGAAVLLVFSVIELIRNYKAGLYKESAYEDDPNE